MGPSGKALGHGGGWKEGVGSWLLILSLLLPSHDVIAFALPVSLYCTVSHMFQSNRANSSMDQNPWKTPTMTSPFSSQVHYLVSVKASQN